LIGYDPSQTADTCKQSTVPLNSASLDAGLYVVATPIGNLNDITLRAIAILQDVDFVACEDTRLSRNLLNRHSISARTIPYHDHNAQSSGPWILDQIKAGLSVALISDAGTPLVSDPGYRLVAACHEQNLRVIPVPGPSAVLSLLSVAGLPTDRFLFLGFLPTRQSQRREALLEVSSVRATLVILESARRVAKTLRELGDALGNRQAVVGRELTKMYEEIRRGPLFELADHYEGSNIPKGEITLAIAPPEDSAFLDDQAVDQALIEAMKAQTPSRAAAEIATLTGRPRQDLYKRAMVLKQT
jgi:16S rRNA (cytidine1402-2'-O)-methyltransferase